MARCSEDNHWTTAAWVRTQSRRGNSAQIGSGGPAPTPAITRQKNGEHVQTAHFAASPERHLCIKKIEVWCGHGALMCFFVNFVPKMAKRAFRSHNKNKTSCTSRSTCWGCKVDHPWSTGNQPRLQGGGEQILDRGLAAAPCTSRNRQAEICTRMERH